MYPTAANALLISLQHHIAKYERAVVDSVSPLLLCQYNYYCRGAVEGVHCIRPSANAAVHLAYAVSQLFVGYTDNLAGLSVLAACCPSSRLYNLLQNLTRYRGALVAAHAAPSHHSLQKCCHIANIR